MSGTNNYELVSIGDDIISYILDSYILILTEINEQFLTFYLKNEGSVMSIFAHLFHHVVFSLFLAINYLKGDETYRK